MMKTLGSCTLIDDDGVVVVASALGLVARAEIDPPFSDDYLRELDDDRAAWRAAAWEAGEEGEVELVIELGDRPADTSTCAGPEMLRLGEGDDVLAMPYSQYTYACSYLKGVPETIPRLSFRVAAPSGVYEVWIQMEPDGRTRVRLSPSSEVVRSFGPMPALRSTEVAAADSAILTLGEIVESLGSYDADPEAALVIYAREPFAAGSLAAVQPDPSDGKVPRELQVLGLSYFLEVSIAREIAAQLGAAADLRLLARLVDYAVRDA